MNPVIRVRFEFKGTEDFLYLMNLQKGGKVQETIDRAAIKWTEMYTPYKTGRLMNSANTASQIGEGKVVYDTPYARKLYFSPQLNFNRTVHPQAGAYWFERMKADHTEDILMEAKHAAGKQS